MGWGGGGGGGWGGGGVSAAQASAAAGLPFAGVPSELADKIDGVLETEPDHPGAVVEFSESTYDRRPLTMRRLLSPHRFGVAVVLVLIVVETIASRLGPTLTQRAIDKGMGLGNVGKGALHGSRHYLYGIVALYIVLVALSIGVGFARTLLAGAIGERLLYDLRVRVFSHFQRLSLDFFTDEKAGRLMTRMTSDIENLQQLFQEGMVQLLLQFLTLGVLSVQMIAFSQRLAFITLVIVVPVMLALTVWFQRASDRGYLTVRDRIADVLADLSESLAGIRLVSAHNRQRQNTVNHVNIVGDYRASNDY